MKSNLEKDGLQAVIVADTFNKNFAPASSCCSLLPLVNIKLLDYTLEWLNMSGVNEVILFCSSHVNEIKLHLKDKVYLGIDIKVLVSENCYSLGDVMRALDSYAVIRSTFILLSVDVIGNVNFTPLVEKFKSIQSVDKEIAMMVLFKEVGNQRPDLHNDFIVAHNSKNRIIHYQVHKSKNIELPMDVLLEQDFVDIRNNLLNPGLAICSVAVPPLFSENFDFQTISDFIRGLLMNEEILKSTVYCEILKGSQYIAKIGNWPTYQVVGRDVIQRWLYPIPNMLDKYIYKKNSNYHDTNLSKGCKLGMDVVIGARTKLEKNVKINRSVIGNNCSIGKNVVIENSYIFDNVKIDENCSVKNSVISHTCVVKRNSIVDNGCVIGPFITLDADSKVNKTCLVSKKLTQKENLVAFSDNCYIFQNSDSEDEEVCTLVTDWTAGANFVYDDSTSDSDLESVSVGEGALEDDDVNIFYNEVEDSLTRGFSEKLKCENLILEVNSSRYVYNVTVSEVNFNVIRAILNINLSDAGSNAKQLWQHMESKLKYFLPVMRNYIKDTQAQGDCLSALEYVTASSNQLTAVLMKIVNYLYDKDILAEETIIAWHKKLFNEEMKKSLLSFIRWLQEAEEESDGESD